MTIAVIGAGPVGLAAAAHLAERGLPFVVFEAGDGVAAAVRQWGHVTFFSPWRFNVDSAAERLLKQPVLRAGDAYERHLYNFIPPALHPFINVIHEGFDATHEREWRVPGELRFDYRDVLFVFCPQSQFSGFARVQTDGRPVLFDLAWLDRI